MFIWALKELAVADIPSLFALRKKQAELKADMEIKSTHHVSAMKNEFYVNSVVQSIRLVCNGYDTCNVSHCTDLELIASGSRESPCASTYEVVS